MPGKNCSAPEENRDGVKIDWAVAANPPGTVRTSAQPRVEGDLLDAYSNAVVGAAEKISPSVVFIEVFLWEGNAKTAGKDAVKPSESNP